ncbi:MAG: type II toxin-antitoxin system ParD family antitoxin [Sphingomonadales bacterium]|nr:type II toxin-antitoxin system ParD family antitoxin [Sphingomonadales bacterium]
MPTKTTSIALGERLAEYARRKVASGEFGSVSEVIRDALRLQEERATFRAKLLDALDEGLASPIDDNFDVDRWYDEEFGGK